VAKLLRPRHASNQHKKTYAVLITNLITCTYILMGMVDEYVCSYTITITSSRSAIGKRCLLSATGICMCPARKVINISFFPVLLASCIDTVTTESLSARALCRYTNASALSLLSTQAHCSYYQSTRSGSNNSVCVFECKLSYVIGHLFSYTCIPLLFLFQ